jgi:predicted methyltransferase
MNNYQTAIEALQQKGVKVTKLVKDNSIVELQVVNPFFMPVVARECENVLGSDFKVTEFPNSNYIKITLKNAA